MTRTLGEVVRRGADNVLANWPLLLIRIAESVAMIVITIAIVAGAILPIVAAVMGGSLTDLAAGAISPERLLRNVSPLLALYLLLVISVVFLVGVIVHSFVQGGIVGSYLEAERRAPALAAVRADFNVFTPELWWSEAKRNVWRFFWIYNVIWAGWSLVILLPLLPLIVVLLLFSESPAAIVVGIGGMIAIMLFAIAMAVVVFLWSQVVLIDAARLGTGVFESISGSWESMRGRLGNIILVGGIAFALSMLVGSVIAGFSFVFEAAALVPSLGLALIPLQILLSLINSAVSTLFGSWMIAALVATLASPRTEVRNAFAPA